MAGPIARRPAGLLDLLLTQQRGQNPNLLGETLVPTIDLGPFYDQERLEVNETTRTASAVGNSDAITVPAGESWRVLNVSCRGTFNAVNQVIKLGLFASVGGSDFVMLAENRAATVGATDSMAVAANLHGAMFPPGSQFGVLVMELDLALGTAFSIVTTTLNVRMQT